MKLFFVLSIILAGLKHANAQIYKNVDNLYQYGVSSSITIGLKFGKDVKITNSFYSYGSVNFAGSINPDYAGIVGQIGVSATYNFLSSKIGSFSSQIHSNIQPVLSPNKANKREDFAAYNQPFYGLANLSYPAVKNVYPTSVSLGTGFICLLSEPMTIKRKTQQVGSIYLKFGHVHVFYQNDGVLFKFMIDGKDRWYTSSVLIAWHSNKENVEVNNAIFAYNRFTGYSPSSYEIAGALNNNLVVYDDPEQTAFNLDYTRFGIGLKSNQQINFNLLNFKYKGFQGQKLVHHLRNFPYHPDNSRSHVSIETGIRTK
ncbi:polymorphic toxin type 23 domain-containing protein [Sphingobacterium hungaricum]|uniref:Bacterial toxin 23 domain-containing protein n=1 Tax=Sphingobacterium hungaricum TaxID=2082723 RepID=A0A928YS07_9SPHI|nr:polymorphic toxin type 23 domain-containing protein [Sphingobacterium hungaricum]MBE8715227.1 hypothetical protein [Sphingobacterium hungaricum]